MRLDNVLSRIGFHSVYEKSIREAVDLAYKHGFSSVQVETAMPIFFPRSTPLELGEKSLRMPLTET
ncbi:MAG: hypothetical protein QXT87_03965 [Thermoproteota archaeon]